MRIEAMTIGDELLDGRVVDTNSVRLAHALDTVGAQVARRTTITDDIDVIVATAREIAARGTALCVVSGGLGPTADDLTAAAFAQLTGVDLLRDAAAVAHITALLARRGRAVTPNQLKQADRPAGAEAVPNPVGTAPGFAVTHAGCRFVSLPGVPREFDAMLEQAVVAPRRAAAAPVARVGLYCFGLIEAEVDARLNTFAARFPAVRLQFRVKFPEVHVTLHAPPAAAAALAAAADWARAQLAPHIYAEREMRVAEATLALLQAQRRSVALAESCTGGLIADMLTDIPGSSAAVHGGIVAYANALKEGLLGVPAATLATHGAVSEPVVQAMAAAVRTRCDSDYGLAVSGIAGPAGGTADKPVGTVWLALAGPQGTESRRLVLGPERRSNKVLAATHALNLLRTALLDRGQS